MTRWELGLYRPFGVELDEIDFLKVSHHGSADASSARVSLPFKALVRRRIGGRGESLRASERGGASRLIGCGEAVYRTDFFGSVTVSVTEGETEITTDFR